MDQLYTLSRVPEGAWEFAQPVHMCFVDLEKVFDHVPQEVLWGAVWGGGGVLCELWGVGPPYAGCPLPV